MICEHCKTNPGTKPGNDILWNGFLDKDTGEYSCWGCRDIHYHKKQIKLNLGNKMIYSEFPVII